MNKNKNNMKGGDILASGGYGCVFKPALKCKSSYKNERKPGYISKLMTEKHAKSEYGQIQTFKKVLEKIPNYNDYFLVSGFSLCEQPILEEEDLSNFKKCKALTKKDFTAENIDSRLNELMSINMPDGGIDVKTFFSQPFSPERMVNMNNTLIDLLINGIKPMNDLDLYHCDIKSGNVLVSFQNTLSKGDEERNQGKEVFELKEGSEIYCKLIDWGLSIHHENKTGIPKRLYRRPFQYNVPFSNILFNKVFTERYSIFLSLLEERNQEIDKISIREFVLQYIFEWNKIRGDGHFKTINSIIKSLDNNELDNIKERIVEMNMNDRIVECEFAYYYIIEYISDILLQFTVNGEFDILNYFNTIFIKVIDIWGFVMIYTMLIKQITDNFTDFAKLTDSQVRLIKEIKNIIFDFLFKNPTKVIDINDLASDLQSLNDIILDIIPDSKSKSKSSSLSLKGGSKTRKHNKTNKTRRKKSASRKKKR
jgi:hypothetical protein